MTPLMRMLPLVGLVVAAGLWAFSAWRGEPSGSLPLVLAVLCSIEIGRRAVFHRTAKAQPAQIGSPEHETVMAFAGYLMVACACAGPTLIVLGLYLLRGEHLVAILLIGGGLFAFPFVFSRPISDLIDRAFGRK